MPNALFPSTIRLGGVCLVCDEDGTVAGDLEAFRAAVSERLGGFDDLTRTIVESVLEAARLCDEFSHDER